MRNPLAYWVSKQERYPWPPRMAINFMTIQPISAEFERVFSAARRMLKSLRARLDVSIIGVCQVLRSWYKADVLPKWDFEMAPIDLGVIASKVESNGDNEGLQYGNDSSATSESDSG
jgi:hypothetical protein